MPTPEEILRESILIVVGTPGHPVFKAIHEDASYLAKIGEDLVAGSDHYTHFEILPVSHLDVEEVSYRAVDAALDRRIKVIYESKDI